MDEVRNGGYAQFLYNMSGRHAPVIVQALERVGCALLADNTRKALAVVPEYWIKKPYTQKSIADITDLLTEYDQRFFTNSASLDDQLFDFIVRNASKIRLP